VTSFPPPSPSHTHLYSPSLCICIYYASLFSLLTHTQSWEVSDATAAEGNDSVEEHRAAVQVSMDEYMSSQYGASADAKAACAVYGTADGNLVVCCTGIATNLRNWWSGSWKGEYTVTLADGSAQITGKVDLLAHYFEDGNVQMNTQKTYNNDGVSFSDSSELGEVICNTIRDWENALQAGLETMYTGMSNQTFKDMRRILPVTYTKFDWSGNQMKLAGQAGNGTL
jgi:capping protein (actin filament) muscle Z-line, alpha